MTSLQAFENGARARALGAKSMVFDWNKAAKLLKELKPAEARAGLAQDWECTGGTIYIDGKVDTTSYTYLASTWAEPKIELDGKAQPCWIYADDSEGWSSGTKWPKSALKIVNS